MRQGNEVTSESLALSITGLTDASDPLCPREGSATFATVRALTPYCLRGFISRIIVFCLSIVAPLLPQNGEAQGRLAKLSVGQKKDDYYVILQRVFHRIYGPDIIVAELFAPGGNEESATGVLKTAKGYEAFALFSSPSVWQTEYRRFLKGIEEHCVDDAGKTIPCPPEPRSETALGSYRDIKVNSRKRVLSAAIAGRLAGVWHQKVREALHRPAFSDYENFKGGLQHYYSIRLGSHNWVTILGQNSDDDTDAGRIAALAKALRGYALGVVSEGELTKILLTIEREE